MQQDQAVFHVGDHFVRVGNKVRREVAAIKLHAFHNFGFCFQTFVFLNGDNTFVANALHGVRDLVADSGFAVGGDGANLSDFVAVFHFTGGILNGGNHVGNSKVDAALEVHRVHAGGYAFHAFAHERLSQNGSCCGAVTGGVVGAGSNLFHHLCAHVFKLVFKLDLFGNRNTIFGDARGAEGFVDHHVAAFRAEGYFYSIGENVYAGQHLIAGICAEFYVFCSHCYSSL